MHYKAIEIKLSPRITASFIVSSRELKEFMETFDVVKDLGYVQLMRDEGAVAFARRLVEEHTPRRREDSASRVDG